FFFQAEDGIRDRNVTGVQTCALPICLDLAQVLLVPLEVLAERRHEAVHRRLTRGELGVDLLSGELEEVRLGRLEGARAQVGKSLAELLARIGQQALLLLKILPRRLGPRVGLGAELALEIEALT